MRRQRPPAAGTPRLDERRLPRSLYRHPPRAAIRSALPQKPRNHGRSERALCRTRTDDPFLTMDNRSENREAAVNCAVGARGSEGRAPQHRRRRRGDDLCQRGPGQSGSVRTPGACRGNGGAVPRRLRKLNRYPSSAARGLQACGGGHVHEAGARLAFAQAFFGRCKLAGDIHPQIAVKRQLRATVSVPRPSSRDRIPRAGCAA